MVNKIIKLQKIKDSKMNNFYFTQNLSIGIVNEKKYLFLGYTKNDSNIMEKYIGEIVLENSEETIKRCELSKENSKTTQEIFPFTRPKLLGYKNSFGFGDRIGLANPAHLRSLKEEDDFAPILAQQSILELNRTFPKTSRSVH